MSTTVLSIIGFVLALGATIVAWIMIVPEKKRPKLNKFLRYIHDLFNFKSLWLEKIIKFLYILETLFCVIGGFLLLFSFETYSTRSFLGGGSTYTRWNGWTGVILLVLGPVITRVVYEFIMLIILQVKNTMDINDKLVPQPGSRFEEKLIAEQKREEELEERRAQQQAAKEAYAYQQQQFQQAQQYQQYQQQYEQTRFDQQQYEQQQYEQQQQFAQQQYEQQQYDQSRYQQTQFTQPEESNTDSNNE